MSKRRKLHGALPYDIALPAITFKSVKLVEDDDIQRKWTNTETIHLAAEGSAKPSTSDGASADYYLLPEGATQLQDLISFKNMNAQVGEAFRALYRMGQASHSDRLRDIRKVLFYMNAELERIEKYESVK